MVGLRGVLVCLVALVVPLLPARADVVAEVDIASQSMAVFVDGEIAAIWPVSTGRAGFRTPRGSFRPTALRRMHYSSKYDNSPMPHSVFFRGGYAIHGTGYVRQLGRPASHGCVRLAKRHAAQLYALVKAHGPRRTRILIR
jgi:lipoprotein-anchoring transpeptidase ErfK/SrfK